jgi:hypothetical protein
MFAPKSWPSVISVYDDWDLTRFFKLNEDREVFPGGVSAAIVRFEGYTYFRKYFRTSVQALIRIRK